MKFGKITVFFAKKLNCSSFAKIFSSATAALKETSREQFHMTVHILGNEKMGQVLMKNGTCYLQKGKENLYSGCKYIKIGKKVTKFGTWIIY